MRKNKLYTIWFWKADIKLKSTSGVSILFALMAFLVAFVIATVLINAALTNAERASRTRQQNQAYLTMESAVDMVKELVTGSTVTFDCVETEVTTRIVGEAEASGSGSTGGNADSTDTGSTWAAPSNIKSASEKSMGNLVTEALLDGVTGCITASGGTYQGMEEFTVNVSAGTGEKALSSVKFTVMPEYSLQFTNGEPDIGASSFHVYMTGKLQSTEYADSVTLNAAGKCIETGSDIAEGDFVATEWTGTGADRKATEETRTDIITHHYEISWNNVLVEKGEVEPESDPEGESESSGGNITE